MKPRQRHDASGVPSAVPNTFWTSLQPDLSALIHYYEIYSTMATVASSWKLMIGGAKVTRPLSAPPRQPAMVWHTRPSVRSTHTCTHTHLVPALIDGAWLRPTSVHYPSRDLEKPNCKPRLGDRAPHAKERQKKVLPALSSIQLAPVTQSLASSITQKSWGRESYH